jgi:hypothetical protein
MDKIAVLMTVTLASLSTPAVAEQMGKPAPKSCFEVCSARPGLTNGHQIEACTDTCEKNRAGRQAH